MDKRIPNMDEISFRRLRSADADVTARLIRTAFAAQPRPTRPPSSALRETAETVAAKIAAGGGIGAFAGGALIAATLWGAKADRCTWGASPFSRRGGAAAWAVR